MERLSRAVAAADRTLSRLVRRASRATRGIIKPRRAASPPRRSRRPLRRVGSLLKNLGMVLSLPILFLLSIMFRLTARPDRDRKKVRTPTAPPRHAPKKLIAAQGLMVEGVDRAASFIERVLISPLYKGGKKIGTNEIAFLILAWSAIALGPPAILGIGYVRQFRSSQDRIITGTRALYVAQLARNLADGRGYVTSVADPLDLHFGADIDANRELETPPGYPLALSNIFWLSRRFDAGPEEGTVEGTESPAEPTAEPATQNAQSPIDQEPEGPAHRLDSAAIGFSSLLWLLSVWMTYRLAMKWGDRRLGGLALAFSVVNTYFIREALEASNCAWLALLLALYAAVFLDIVLRPTLQEEAERGVEFRSLVALGLAAGLIMISSYAMTALILPATVWVVLRRRGARRLLPLAGMALMLCVWTFCVGGKVWTAARMPALNCLNDVYVPGRGLFATLQPPASALTGNLSRALPAVLEKLLRNFLAALRSMTTEAGLLPSMLCIGFLLVGSLTDRQRRSFFGPMYTGVLLFLLVQSTVMSWPIHDESVRRFAGSLDASAASRLLANAVSPTAPFAALTPLISIGGAFLIVLLLTRLTPASTVAKGVKTTSIWKRDVIGPVMRWAVAVSFVLAAAAPALSSLPFSRIHMARRALDDMNRRDRSGQVQESLTDESILVSDMPEFLTWFHQKTALRMPLFRGDMTDLRRLLDNSGKEHAEMYLLRTKPRTSPGLRTADWRMVDRQSGGREIVAVGAGGMACLIKRPPHRSPIATSYALPRSTIILTRTLGIPARYVAAQGGSIWQNATRGFREADPLALLTAYAQTSRETLYCTSLDFWTEYEMRRGAAESAIELTKHLIPMFPNNRSMTAKLVARLLYYRQMDYVAMLVERWESRNETPPLPTLHYAMVLTYQGKRERASRVIAADARRKCALGLHYVTAKQLELESLVQIGLHQEAVSLGSKLIEMFPRDPNTRKYAYLAVARCYINLGNPEQAVSTLERARQDYPNWREVWLDMAKAYEEANMLGKAEDALKEWVRTVTPHAEYYGRLGALKMRGGDHEAAVRAYKEGLRQTPNNAALLNNLAYLYAEIGSNLEWAQGVASILVQERPNNIHFRDTLAWVLYRKHDYRQARDALRPMEDSMSRYPTVAYHYALALLKLKQNEEARRFLKLAVTNAKPNSSWLNTANGLLEDMERQTPGGK